MDSDKIIGIVAILLFFIIVGFYVLCVSVIPPDENGIIFRKYDGGIDKEYTFMPGRQITAPWDQLITYKITTQEASEQMATLAKDGLVFEFNFTYRFRVNPSKLGFLHEEIGSNYNKIIIRPELRSVLREVIGKYPSGEIVSMKNKQFEDELFHRARRTIETKYLILESVSIQEITPPASLGH